MKRTLDSDLTVKLGLVLSEANAATARLFPGDSAIRQPVHTVYGGAHLFRGDTAPRLGAAALAALDAFAPDARTFAGVLGLDAGWSDAVYARVRKKLLSEPVEDFRIDFEDGYGNRSDGEEDGHAVSAAAEVSRGAEEGTLPPFLGIRIKPLTEELRGRSLRTLDGFLTQLAGSKRGLPPNFVVTLPKVTNEAQVAVLADAFDLLEPRLGLPAGSLNLEVMVETPQSIFGADGRVALPSLVRAGRGRCVAAHFGTYDYTASLNITAAWQNMAHPACDFAKHVMQVSLAGTGVTLSDGATNVMPVGLHKAPKGGPPLTEAEEEENRLAVHRAWRLHYGHVRRSLEGAFYQGWDLHPAQLPTRYAAVYGFFLESRAAAGERLKNFVSKAAQATLVGDVFDDAATGQGLLNFFLRGISCGALAEDEVLATGITLEELRGRSFVKILGNRTER